MEKTKLNEKDISRRNYFLKKFFFENGIDISLLGEKENPLIVTTDNIVLSCYAHNFDLIFKDNSYNGNICFTIKLNFHSLKCSLKLNDWIQNSNHRKIYLFTYNNMFFSSYKKHLGNVVPFYSPCKDFSYYVFQRQKAIDVKLKMEESLIFLDIIY